jgi:DNA-binding NtrC family response regulator
MADREPLALVLEDTDLGRWALTRALEAAGYVVHAASTWAEACTWLLRARFTLALVEVPSPGQAADIVVDVSQYPYTHVVLLTHEDTVGELRLVCGPACDILPKPVDLERVAHIARSCLESGTEARRA